MEILELQGKVEAANEIVANYKQSSYAYRNDVDGLIEECERMLREIGQCFGVEYVAEECPRESFDTDEEYFAVFGKIDIDNPQILRLIWEEPERFKKFKYRAILRLIRLRDPREAVKYLGYGYISSLKMKYEKRAEEKMIEMAHCYAKEHSDEYAIWAKQVEAKSKMSMIGQIGHDFLEEDMFYGCKRETYPKLLEEEYWLDGEMKSGDAWAAFTQGCLCYYGAVRWKEAVECYGNFCEMMGIITEQDA